MGATATGSDAGQVAGRGLPRIGEVFNGYSVVELLGQGNMGRIYRVRDQLGRDLALKVILGQVASPEGLARFEREGQAMAAIPRHKHVIGVHSAGTAAGLPYLVLDFVKGENLDEVLRRGPLPAAQAALVCEKLSRALDHVHQSGVLHRDLKPANVLIRAADGEPLLTDFGLAGLQGADTLTRTGDVIGTPLYMAPEQLLGLHKEVDGRADVWSLGVMLFEMAAGALPFPGTTMLEVTDAVLGADPPRLHDRCPDADSGLTRIVNLALAKDKSERLPSPGALAAVLRTWRKQRQGYEVELDLPPPPGRKARRRWLYPLIALALTAIVVTAVAVIVANLPESSPTEATPSASPRGTAGSSGSLSAAAASAIEAVEAVDRSDRGYKDLERALASPDLKGLPHVGRVRLRAIGYTALQQITVELRQPKPRPDVIAGYLRAAGMAQRLSEYDLGGGSNVDGILSWLENRFPTDSSIVFDQAWLKVFSAIAESGFRPSQRTSGGFLDTISLKPPDRQHPSYLRILRHLVAVGAPTFYNQFDLKARGKPNKPPETAGDVGRYVYYRTLICSLDRADASDQDVDEVRREMARLVRTRSSSFEPRTLAQALNFALLPGKENLEAEISRLEKALQAGPDGFFGWDGLIHLYLELAEVRAQARDDEGVRAAYQRASDVVARGRRALDVDNARSRPPTEAIALRVFLVRQVELLVTQDKDATRAGTILSDKDVRDATRRGQDRRKRIRAYSRGG
jgi:serine/threonine protein kinase